MSLSTKILVAILTILVICMGGFIVFKEIQNEKMITEIQKSVIEQKQLLDNISRAQSSYASKEDIENFAKQQNINLDVIRKDVQGLNAEIKGINGITVVSKGQNDNNLPSTDTTPRPDHVSPDPSVPDPFGYLSNAQNFDLNEKFSNVDVPFGKISFSAWREKPWDVNVIERKYSITSVLAQDENGKHYSYSKFAIQSGGKTYNVKIDDNKFIEEYPASKMSWLNPKLFMFANAGVDVSSAPISGEFTPGVSIGVISYGKTKVNPSMSFLQLGIGYGVVNKHLEFSLSPIQYNLGQHLPLISNTYIGPTIQTNLQGHITPGAGVSVGF